MKILKFRYRKIIINTSLAVFLTLSTSFIFAQEIVRGQVYVDENHNQEKDRREKGLAGVAVTNGQEIVLTDEKGFYELTIQPDQIISVIKPKGYAVKIDSNQISRNYYIHKPQGSFTKAYEGVLPTGNLPKSVDFGLTIQDEPSTFRFLVFGDPQMSHPEDIYYFREGILNEVKDYTDAKFGITLGDIVGNVLERIPPYIDAVKEVGVPWYNVLGNHDINFDVEEDKFSDETFERLFGPPTFAFNYGNAQFLIVDNVIYPYPKGSQSYVSGFRDDQWKFIDNYLKIADPNQLLVIAGHIPFINFKEEDRLRLYSLLEGFENLLFLSAHTHLQQQMFHDEELGWKGKKPIHEYNVGTTCGDWYSGQLDERGVPNSMMRDGTPMGYAYINIDDKKYSINYKVSGQDKSKQINLFVPKVIRKGRGSYNFYANFFMGHKNSEVSFRINGGEWHPMTFSPTHDPNYVLNLYEWDTSETLLMGKRSFYRAVNSTHLWNVQFPRNLEVGEYTLEVRAKDMFDRYHIAQTTFRVETHQPEPLLLKYSKKSLPKL